jgi:hypothetical protein
MKQLIEEIDEEVNELSLHVADAALCSHQIVDMLETIIDEVNKLKSRISHLESTYLISNKKGGFAKGLNLGV